MSAVRNTLCWSVLFVLCVGCAPSTESAVCIESAIVSAKLSEDLTSTGFGTGAVLEVGSATIEMGCEALFFFSEPPLETVEVFNIHLGSSVMLGRRHGLVLGARFHVIYATRWTDSTDGYSPEIGSVNSVALRLGYSTRLGHTVLGVDFFWSRIYDYQRIPWFDEDFTMVRVRLSVPLGL